MRNLLIGGGYHHPIEANGPAIADVLRRDGIDTHLVGDVELGSAELRDGSYDLLTVTALQWQMLHPRYDEVRAEWARPTSAMTRTAIASWVAEGRPVLAVHAALISFDDWAEWSGLLRGAWNWDRSHHPPIHEFEVEPVGNHPIVSGITPFIVDDERYSDIEVGTDVEVLLHSAGQPLLWATTAGDARVVYDALGHHGRSISQPTHAVVLRRAVAWLLGRREAEIEDIS